MDLFRSRCGVHYLFLWLNTSSLRIKKLEPRSQVSHNFVSWRVTACAEHTHTHALSNLIFRILEKRWTFLRNMPTFTPARTIFFAVERSQKCFVSNHCWSDHFTVKYQSAVVQKCDAFPTYLDTQCPHATEEDWGPGHLVHSTVSKHIALAAGGTNERWGEMWEKDGSWGALQVHWLQRAAGTSGPLFPDWTVINYCR